jgi:AcrR family transcriptional regulator
VGKAGRRAQAPTGESRHRIHEAALAQFSQRGFTATTIRSIAEEAGVDPALVMHFFGSKEQLFEACVQWPFDPDEKIAAVVAGGVDRAGEAIVTLFVETWDARDGRNPIVALLRTALGQQSSERLLRDFLELRLLVPLIEALGLEDAELRSGLIAAQLLGLGAARYLLRFEALAALPAAEVIKWVAPTVQRYLAEPPAGD